MTEKAYIPGTRHYRRRKLVGAIVRNAILIFFSLLIALPFFWMLTNSLKTKNEIWARPPVLWPAVPQWSNFSEALGDGYLMRYTFNSLFVALAITAIVLFNSAMFGYALTHVRMKGKTFFFTVIMITYIMPSAVTNIPSYVILAKLNLINTHLGLIISQISPAIVESAKMDGASHMRILWQIVAPMSFSTFITLGVFSFIGSYNSYVWPSLILQSKEKYLVSQGMQLFFVAEGAYGMKWGAIMATCMN